jgi:hypothetical protein
MVTAYAMACTVYTVVVLRHVKGVSGSKPLDPEGGVKFIQVVIKMNPIEAVNATNLARSRGISRSELIRQLIAREVDTWDSVPSTPRATRKRTRA